MCWNKGLVTTRVLKSVSASEVGDGDQHQGAEVMEWGAPCLRPCTSTLLPPWDTGIRVPYLSGLPGNWMKLSNISCLWVLVIYCRGQFWWLCPRGWGGFRPGLCPGNLVKLEKSLTLWAGGRFGWGSLWWGEPVSPRLREAPLTCVNMFSKYLNIQLHAILSVSMHIHYIFMAHSTNSSLPTLLGVLVGPVFSFYLQGALHCSSWYQNLCTVSGETYLMMNFQVQTAPAKGGTCFQGFLRGSCVRAVVLCQLGYCQGVGEGRRQKLSNLLDENC